MRRKRDGGSGKRGEDRSELWGNQRRAFLSVFILVACVASTTSAQGAKKGASSGAICAINPSDAWVRKQAEWFDESRHDWKDDTLRTLLLAATGLTPPLKAPVQLGVHI